MMFQFFWTRTASIWIAVLYIALGIPLLFFPDMSGALFVWALAGGAAAYAFSHLWRYLQGRKHDQLSGGDLFLTVIPLAFAIFALFWPQAILSFLPLVLGALLLVDGVGKIPLVMEAIHTKDATMPSRLFATVVPIFLGVLLVVNPFRVAHVVIMFFGAALIADGIGDLVTALVARKAQPEAPAQPPTQPESHD